VREIALDDGIQEAENRHSGVVAAGGDRLRVLLNPAAASSSRTQGQPFWSLERIASVMPEGASSDVGMVGKSFRGWRAWRVLHTSSDGSRMGLASRQRTARALLPITRKRWMNVALQWCSGWLRVIWGAGMAGVMLGTPSSWRRCSRVCVPRAFPLACVSRTRAGSAGRLSSDGSAQVECVC
jgi:hypothetical protein